MTARTQPPTSLARQWPSPCRLPASLLQQAHRTIPSTVENARGNRNTSRCAGGRSRSSSGDRQPAAAKLICSAQGSQGWWRSFMICSPLFPRAKRKGSPQDSYAAAFPVRNAIATSPCPADSRGPLQSRPTSPLRRNEVPRPIDAPPASRPPLAEPAGHLPNVSAERSGKHAVHGSWARTSAAESRTAFWFRLPFKYRCRRMPYNQVENRQRPSNRRKDRHASTSVSCARSSAQ